MKIKVASSFTGVISRGMFENSRPGFNAEIEYEFKPLTDFKEYLESIDRQQKLLHKICYENFKACEDQAVAERITRERQDIRFYVGKDGKRVPSVTSIINFDADMFCAPEALAQYASQSNLCHAQVEEFIHSGEWKEAKDILGSWSDIVIVTKGNLNLETSGWSFPDFLKKYPILNMKNSKAGFNDEHKYAGTPDFEGIPDFEGAEKVDTIFDVKRTPDKVKNFKQMAGYAKMGGNEHIKQMVIVPLNNKTKQGFSQPIIETRIDQYFEMFLKDREAFKKRFGI